MLKVLCLPVVLAMLPWAQEPDRVARNVRPYVGIWGADSKIKTSRRLRITSTKQLQKVWLEHVGADPAKFTPYYNTQGVPDVDFEACMVVAIFQGAGYNTAGVRIVEIEENATRLRVRYDDRPYQTEGPDGGAQRANAFGFFVIPRSRREVVLEENVQSLIGQPPEWKERARLPALR